MDLFRPQAIAEQLSASTGEVIAIGKLPFRLFTVLILIFVIALLGFVFYGRYAQTQLVSGVLIPTGGITRVRSSLGGVITDLAVTEGQIVVQGQPLFTVQSAQGLDGFADYNEALIEQMEVSIQLQEEVVIQQKKLNERAVQDIQQKINDSEQQLKIQKNQLVRQQEITALLQKQLASQRQLMLDKHISRSTYEEKERELLSGVMQVNNINRDLLQLQSQISSDKRQLENLPEQQLLGMLSLQQEITEKKRFLIEIRSRLGQKIQSPIAGMVSNFIYREGSYIPAGRAMLTILPADDKLQVELYVPSSARGFIKIGQDVLVRYQAFPYQKFGTHKSKITEISTTVMVASELPIELPIQEPVYRVRATLKKQYVIAYGKQLPLQTGMSLDAEIIREHRSIIEWVMEPLFSIKGRAL